MPARAPRRRAVTRWRLSDPSAADTAAAFRPDGTGAVVNSSRGITACFKPDEPAWEAAVAQATRASIAALCQATPMGALTR